MNYLKKTQHISNGIVSAKKKHISGDYSEHSHDYFEIEYVISGTGNYIIDGKSYTLKKNMLFFMSPANFHGIKSCNAEIINIMFSCDLIDTAFLFNLFSSDSVNATLLNENDSILIEKLLMEIADSQNPEYILQFLRCVLYKISSFTTKSQNHIASNIRKAIVYIIENFRSNITLEDTAKHVGLAPAYLSQLFLSETGTNFKSYLDSIKFDYAAKMLIFTDMSILEICYNSGFSDYSNFTRRFKLRFGTAPTQYRNKKS